MSIAMHVFILALLWSVLCSLGNAYIHIWPRLGVRETVCNSCVILPHTRLSRQESSGANPDIATRPCLVICYRKRSSRRHGLHRAAGALETLHSISLTPVSVLLPLILIPALASLYLEAHWMLFLLIMILRSFLDG